MAKPWTTGTLAGDKLIEYRSMISQGNAEPEVEKPSAEPNYKRERG
jgi:hypothetical protein